MKNNASALSVHEKRRLVCSVPASQNGPLCFSLTITLMYDKFFVLAA